MGWKKYLKLDEATITYGYPNVGPHAVAQDDDYPTGNIIMGDKYKSVEYYNRLTSFNVNWVPETKPWKWDEFATTVTQSSVKSYHDTLKKDGPIDPKRLFKQMGKYEPKPVPKKTRLLGNEIGPFDDAWGDKDKFLKTADTDDVEGPEHSDHVEGPEMNNTKSKKNKLKEDVINKINFVL